MQRWTSLLFAVLLAGCVSSQGLIARRIAAKPDVFAALPEVDQARVRQGEIRVGDAADVVWIARGQPGRIYRRETADGTNTVWSYTREQSDSGRNLVPVTVWGRSSRGELRPTTEYVWIDRDSRREYEALRVEFRAGRVWAVERLDERP